MRVGVSCRTARISTYAAARFTAAHAACSPLAMVSSRCRSRSAPTSGDEGAAWCAFANRGTPTRRGPTASASRHRYVVTALFAGTTYPISWTIKLDR